MRTKQDLPIYNAIPLILAQSNVGISLYFDSLTKPRKQIIILNYFALMSFDPPDNWFVVDSRVPHLHTPFSA
jgi:hypothetical protein